MPLDLSNFSKPQYDPSELTGGGGGGVGLSTANTFTGVQTAPDIAVGGITGATQLMRLVGATTSGAPTTGTFQVGDTVLSKADGKWYTCTVTGTPGTWVSPVIGGGGSAYDAAVLADTPVAYWLLNELSGTSAADASGNGHTGTYNGTYTLGQTGPCSDGEKSVAMNVGYVTVPHTPSLAILGSITLEGWVNMPSIPTYGWLINKDVGSTVSSYDLSINIGLTGPYLVRQQGLAGSATQIGTNAWVHIAVTWDTPAGVAKIYFNGVSQTLAAGSSVPADIPATDGGADVIIGSRGDVYAPFVGNMAKVAVYNTPLSAARIAAHYAAR